MDISQPTPPSRSSPASSTFRACWTSICEAIHECVTGQERIAAVAITSQRQSIVFLDSDANVLYAGPNTDLSAIFAGVVLDYDHGDLLYRTTGHRPAFMMAAGKLAWLKDHRPESYEKRLTCTHPG